MRRTEQIKHILIKFPNWVTLLYTDTESLMYLFSVGDIFQCLQSDIVMKIQISSQSKTIYWGTLMLSFIDVKTNRFYLNPPQWIHVWPVLVMQFFLLFYLQNCNPCSSISCWSWKFLQSTRSFLSVSKKSTPRTIKVVEITWSPLYILISTNTFII